MEYLQQALTTVTSYLPTSADVAAFVPSFRDESGEPRYGLIAATAGIAAGMSYYVVRSTLSRRDSYPRHLLPDYRDRPPSAPSAQTTTTDATTAAIDTTSVTADADAATATSPTATSLSTTTTAEPITLTTVNTIHTSPAGPMLLILVVSVALAVSLGHLHSSGDDQDTLFQALHFWNWASHFPLFLPLFYTALGLILHQHLVTTSDVLTFDSATTPPLEIISGAVAAEVLASKKSAPMPSPPNDTADTSSIVHEARKTSDEDGGGEGGGGGGGGETKSSLPDSPSRLHRRTTSSRRGTMVVPSTSSTSDLHEMYEDLDASWLESENGKVDKMKVLNQVMAAIAKHRAGDDTPVGLLWRASRAESNVASWEPDIDLDVKSRYVQHALGHAERAVAQSKMEKEETKGETKGEEEELIGDRITDVDRSASHKFLAIGLGQKTQFMSNPKDKLNLASEILEHIEIGLSLNANDPMLWYMRGQWRYNIAEIPYAVRYGASWVTGTLLMATYEEALSDFEEATRVDQYFYCDNFFMAARTLLKMKIGREEEAKSLLSKGIAMEVANPTTKVLQEKAKSLLKKLSV